MDNLEKDLKKLLEDKNGFDFQKSEKMRKETDQMKLIFERFVKDIRQARLVYWITFLLCLGMMAAGYIGFRSAVDTKGMLSWVLFFMIGFNSTILIKLWYWVVDTKFNVLKEIKQLQLQIAESTGKSSSAEN
jgi:hypothetical protein